MIRLDRFYVNDDFKRLRLRPVPRTTKSLPGSCGAARKMSYVRQLLYCTSQYWPCVSRPV